MKGRILDYSLGFNHRQRVTIELETDFKEGYERLKDKDIEISIKEWKKRRSRDANAYFHVLVGEIAQARGLPAEEVKRQIVKEYGAIARDDDGKKVGIMLPASVDVDSVYPYARWYKSTTQEGKTYNCYLLIKHTHEMDTAEMSVVINGAVEAAKELGIDTDTPEERERWKGY